MMVLYLSARLISISLSFMHLAHTHSSEWEKQFAALLAYKAKHGHCNAPTKGSPLGRWISKMRKFYKKYDMCKGTKPCGWNDELESRYLKLKHEGFIFSFGAGKGNE